MPTRAQTAATLHSEIGASTYSAPPTPAHRAILAALVASGVLTSAGAYAAGKGQADVLWALTTPDVTQETLERLTLTRGI